MRCEEDKNSKPAIEGGKPVREKYLVFGEALLGAEEIEAVVKTLQSGWISTGPQSVEFAKQFKEYVGASFSVATNSCTSALHLALAACGVKRGDEVITTPMTFAATVNVIVHQGA
ncbi:MAG: DegT/DnrJ/EryC1/StrS family aminotransferase, partial [Candidatus Omnitrophica bacterium]|nr:DegT/DnrJ/EryC1/StrS family aminotransferase [Candidatus Omnitrophota bacterium]